MRRLFAVWLIVAGAGAARAGIGQVAVTGGTVAGTAGDGVAVFKGIPFAAPPVGALRWRAPQPVRRWAGVRRATAFGPGCMQDPAVARQMGMDVPLSEDCLFVDVWTPARAPRDRLPVIAWIYGGGFNGGATSVPLYDGANLARAGVVVVSISYRVGPFGFLASPALSRESGHGSGQYGLLDQIAGLKWVRANIARFGGDPARVTVLGHSAGAYAVSMLAASPLAKGLFRGVIAESGANFAPAADGPWSGTNLQTLGLAERNGERWLRDLGAATLAQARALPAAEIEAAQRAPGAPRFWPPLDGWVVPDDQLRLWRAGRFNAVPVVVGSNSDEAASFGARGVTPAAFEAEVRAGYGAGADAILAAYPHGTDAAATRAAKGLRRDTGFGWVGYAWARAQAASGRAPAWLYYFDRPTAANPDGSPHGAEVGLVFGNARAGRPGFTAEDRAVSAQLQGHWVNFARTGDPNGAGLPRWPAFAAADPVAFRIGRNPGPAPVPNLDQLRALDAYYAWRRGAAAATSRSAPARP